MSGQNAVKEVLREATLWFVVIVAGFGLIYFSESILEIFKRGLNQAERLAWTSPAPNSLPEPPPNGFDRVVRVRADTTGHFAVRGWVNGQPLALMADTGATYVALTFDDADRLGLHPRLLNFDGEVSTANGVARVAKVTLDSLRVDGIEVHDIPALIAPPNAMPVSLLGMSFLSRLKRFEVAGRELVLTQ